MPSVTYTPNAFAQQKLLVRNQASRSGPFTGEDLTSVMLNAMGNQAREFKFSHAPLRPNIKTLLILGPQETGRVVGTIEVCEI